MRLSARQWQLVQYLQAHDDEAVCVPPEGVRGPFVGVDALRTTRATVESLRRAGLIDEGAVQLVVRMHRLTQAGREHRQ